MSNSKDTYCSKFPISNASKLPATASEIPSQVVQLIEAMDYDAACRALQKIPNSRLQRHLLGVCLIRAGRISEAVEVFRILCLDFATMAIRADAEDTMKINYATAILLSGIPSGALDILAAVDDHSHPVEAAMRAAIEDWAKKLSFWRRLDWRINRIDPPNATVPMAGVQGILPIDLPVAKPAGHSLVSPAVRPESDRNIAA